MENVIPLRQRATPGDEDGEVIGVMHVVFAPSVARRIAFHPVPASDWTFPSVAAWMLGVLKTLVPIQVHLTRKGRRYTVQFGGRAPIANLTERELGNVLGGAIELAMACKEAQG
jgi:hypothetical protein